MTRPREPSRAMGAARTWDPFQLIRDLMGPDVFGGMVQPESGMFAPDIEVKETNDAYVLTAENAVQDIASPDVIELQNLRARMEMQDKDVVNMTANAGTYNTKGDKIVLIPLPPAVRSAACRSP